MSKFKDFILQKKLLAFKKARLEKGIPEQGSYITLFNNNYKVLTKPDSKIAIIEDDRSNKIAYSRESLAKMLNEAAMDIVEKADSTYGTKPQKLVGPGGIGNNAKPKVEGQSAAPVKPVDPVGTIRNGRKKVVSKRTGETMWINIASGAAHEEHDTHETQEPHPEAQAQVKEFFTTLKDNLHPGDKLKLQRQMKELIDLRQKTMNILDMAHQDARQNRPEAESNRNRVFSLQDQYKKAFKNFKEDVKTSVAKRKKESGSEK